MNNLSKLAGILVSLAVITGCERSSERASKAMNKNQPVQENAGAEAKSAESKDADNTARNERDRSGATLTPGDQGNSDADRDITRRVRRTLTADDQLSTTAKNIKIITIDGKVTLRGTVKSEEEKTAIANAMQQAGITSFDNELEVKTTNQ